MARLTATMSVAQAVGAYAALRRHADSRRNAGDARGIGQIMSDELFARLATNASASAAHAADTKPGVESLGASGTSEPPGVNVEVGLVMTERTLLRGGSDPAVLTDPEGRAFGQVPAMLARRHVRGWAAGGLTESANGAGLCEACNYAKEAPGWRADVIGHSGHVLEIRTPTGHRYRFGPPRAPGHHAHGFDEHLEHWVDDQDDGVAGVGGAA